MALWKERNHSLYDATSKQIPGVGDDTMENLLQLTQDVLARYHQKSPDICYA